MLPTFEQRAASLSTCGEITITARPKHQGGDISHMVPYAGAPVVQIDEDAPDGVGEVDGLLRDRHLRHGPQPGAHAALRKGW